MYVVSLVPEMQRSNPWAAQDSNLPRRDPAVMDIIKNKTNMTVEEASKLRNGHGKNLNGGKYIHPSIPENPTGDGLKMIALIVGFVVFFITVLTSS